MNSHREQDDEARNRLRGIDLPVEARDAIPSARHPEREEGEDNQAGGKPDHAAAGGESAPRRLRRQRPTPTRSSAARKSRATTR